MPIVRKSPILAHPFEVRELNPGQCVRFYSDFFNKGDFVESATAAAAGVAPTIVYASGTVPGVYDSKTAGNVNLITVATGTASTSCQAGAQVSITDRSDRSANAALRGGVAEMDISARVKYTRNASALSVARVGFFNDTTTTDDIPQGLCFKCFNADTWSVAVYSGDYNGSSGYKFVKDTGIDIATFHTLEVWVNALGTEAWFMIDDNVVHRQTNDVPNINSTQKTATATNGFQAGIGIMCTGTQVAASTLVCDWMRYRFFPNRRA